MEGAETFTDGELQRVEFITHTASQFFLGKLGTVKQVGHLLGKACHISGSVIVFQFDGLGAVGEVELVVLIDGA